MFSGGSKTGNLAFLVSENEVNSLVIYVGNSFGRSDDVYFSTVPGLFPIAVGSDGPVAAAVQGRLGLTADCDLGNQTRAAVEQWQGSVGRPTSGTIDAQDWQLLEISEAWGTDANANGQIDPDELALDCNGNVELPEG